jgi:hypothetical protein
MGPHTLTVQATETLLQYTNVVQNYKMNTKNCSFNKDDGKFVADTQGTLQPRIIFGTGSISLYEGEITWCSLPFFIFTLSFYTTFMYFNEVFTACTVRAWDSTPHEGASFCAVPDI